MSISHAERPTYDFESNTVRRTKSGKLTLKRKRRTFFDIFGSSNNDSGSYSTDAAQSSTSNEQQGSGSKPPTRPQTDTLRPSAAERFQQTFRDPNVAAVKMDEVTKSLEVATISPRPTDGPTGNLDRNESLRPKNSSEPKKPPSVFHF